MYCPSHTYHTSLGRILSPMVQTMPVMRAIKRQPKSTYVGTGARTYVSTSHLAYATFIQHSLQAVHLWAQVASYAQMAGVVLQYSSLPM